MRTLVLTQAYQPHEIVSWQRAICLLFAGKAEIVEQYDQAIRSVTLTIKMPAVVRLLRAFRGPGRAIKFSRVNVLTRDGFRCQYCGQSFPMRELTYDHVIPRVQGGPTSWENIVAACTPCNSRKANRTPAQAGMRLLSKPVKPRSLPLISLRLDLRGADLPSAWASWVYWQGPLS